jgi:hypothetical protein
MKKHSFDDIMFSGFLLVIFFCITAIVGSMIVFAPVVVSLVFFGIMVGIPLTMYVGGRMVLRLADYIRDRRR